MKEYFQQLLNIDIDNVSSISDGDINEAYRIETADEIYFAKVNTGEIAKKMLKTEAKGLKHLSNIGGLKVPDIIANGYITNKAILVLEWIVEGNSNIDTPKNLASQLAKLHNTTNLKFGLDYDNFIGSLHQPNKQNNDWLSFYYINRIEYQLKIGIDSGLLQKSLIKTTERMFNIIEQDFPSITPSLLHGDLWSGNHIIDSSSSVVFIDPAIYYGHREMDIAMMKLFGGFDQKVFDLYNEYFPFDKEWQNRIKFYQLYYILVHVNLFGGSYAQSAKGIIDYYGGY